jgi:outer membrane immunogenic protein
MEGPVFVSPTKAHNALVLARYDAASGYRPTTPSKILYCMQPYVAVKPGYGVGMRKWASELTSFIAGMIRAIVACVLAIPLTVSLARAADLPVKTPVQQGPSVYSWTGNYLGGDLGARWDNINADVTSVFTGTPPITGNFGPGSSFNGAAIRAGLFVGRNWQLGPRWVIGIEADGSWADQNKSQAGSPYPGVVGTAVPGFRNPAPMSATAGSSFAVRTTWDASLRLRAGWLVTPSVLLYGTGGVAFMELQTNGACTTVFQTDLSSSCSPGNYYNGTLGPVVNSQTATLVGGTIGAGIEATLAPNWSWRAEYRYSDFGNRNFTDVRTCSGCDLRATPLAVNYSTHVSTQIALAGIAYKFSN